MVVFAQSFTKGPISNTSFREGTGASFIRTDRQLFFHSIRNLFSPFQLTNNGKKPASTVVNYTAGIVAMLCAIGLRNAKPAGNYPKLEQLQNPATSGISIYSFVIFFCRCEAFKQEWFEVAGYSLLQPPNEWNAPINYCTFKLQRTRLKKEIVRTSSSISAYRGPGRFSSDFWPIMNSCGWWQRRWGMLKCVRHVCFPLVFP